MLLYIHIPYCDSKCHYCSFNSYVDKFDTRFDYMSALHTQLVYELDRFRAKENSIETVFIGGGTPSTVAPELYTKIFDTLKPYLHPNAEINTEANPNSSTALWLKGMKELGVNRVSFGVQSFDIDKLKALNRAHSPAQAVDAINNAHSIGFEHISLDLIYNYKGDTKSLLKSDIDKAFTLPIDHISAYELTIEDNTKFSATPEVRQEDENLAFFVAKHINELGFKQYEISNFGAYKSRHNIGYWELRDYMGVGAGAVGFLEDTRYYPVSNIDAYIKNPLNITTEKLTPDELQMEKIFLGLRSYVGIEASILTAPMKQKAQILLEGNKLTAKNNFLYNHNYFLADELSLFLLS